MSRDLPAGLDTALQQRELAPIFLVAIDWPGAILYFWNGYGDLAWDGHTWVGTGHLGGISQIKESVDGSVNGLVLSLSGIPTALVAEALRNDTQTRSAKVYFGVLTAAGFTIEPYLAFNGLIDVPTITSNGKTATISLQLEKETMDNRSNFWRYTHEDQQIKYPGDLGLQYVAAIVNQPFRWGSSAPAAGTNPGANPDSVHDASF